MAKYTMLMDQKNQYSENEYTTQSNLQTQGNPYQATNGIFHRTMTPHVKSWLVGKDFDAGRDWGPEEKRTTEDEMTGWHHRLDAHESEWIPGVGDGQGGLVYCDSWGHKELDTTEWLNWTELMTYKFIMFMEIQKPLNSQSNLEKEEWNWRNQPVWLQTIVWVYKV